MKLKYFAIDIETTGLNAECDQILEIAIIFDDLEKNYPLNLLPKFHCYVHHKRIEGDAYELAMKNKILSKIVKEEEEVIPIELVTLRIKDWIDKLKEEWLTLGDRIVIAGKNAGTFDLRFLERLPLWKSYIKTNDRVIDIGNLFINETDLVPPDLLECKRRAGFEDLIIEQTAIMDTLDVIRLIRNKYNLPIE